MMKIGKPTHFRLTSSNFSPNKINISACGLINPEYAAYDGRHVDCLACRRTRAWSAYVGQTKLDRPYRVYIKQVNQTYVDVYATSRVEAEEKGYRKWRKDVHSEVSSVELREASHE